MTIKGHNATVNGKPVFVKWKIPLVSPELEEAPYHLELAVARYHSYNCPFSIFDEFEQWFEWHRLTLADKHTTGRVITFMLRDIKRIRKYRIKKTMQLNSRHFSLRHRLMLLRKRR